MKKNGNTRSAAAAIMLREWLAFASAAAALATFLYLGKTYLPQIYEWRMLGLLASLFICAKGLEKSGAVKYVIDRLPGGRGTAPAIVAAVFILSMFVTNDAALAVAVPAAMALNTDRKGLLVILLALAANAGSALTPFGNPQNIFIFFHYHLSLIRFTAVIFPFSAIFFVLIITSAFVIKGITSTKRTDFSYIEDKANAAVYFIFTIWTAAAVCKLVPAWPAVGVAIYALIKDKRSLKIDYMLLLTFLFLFCATENLKEILQNSRLLHTKHVFLISAVASQFMSNVPSTVLIAKFTDHWKSLLWGVSVGGFGNIFASFANIIAYKLYLNYSKDPKPFLFTLKFTIAGYLSFIVGIILYAIINVG